MRPRPARSTPTGSTPVTGVTHTHGAARLRPPHSHSDPAGKDNSSHSTENMACMIAGRAGGLKGGQHLVATGMHPGNVLNTAMRAVGVDQDLGEVVGVVPGLLA